MTRQTIVDKIISEKLVVVIRTKNAEEVQLIIDVLVEAGVGVMEVTSNTPNFEAEINKARSKYPNILIGAGTIISVELAEKAMKAGAQFLVTPSVEPDVCEFAHKHNIPVLMGALTPTEISNALKANADIIKLFPADILGINYLKALMGPFDKVPFFAVGGIGNENAKDWIKAGAKGLGVGGKLTQLKGKDTKVIVKSAQELFAYLND